MILKHLKLVIAAGLITMVGACGGGAVTGPPEGQEVAETPDLRTACMVGGEVAQRAGCPEDTWSNTGDPFNPWEEDLSPREKRPN